MQPWAQRIERLGAPSGRRGLSDPRDLWRRLLPGLLAQRRISREQGHRHERRTHVWIEQLGAPSGGRLGFARLGDVWRRGLPGLVARARVAREAGGLDLRYGAYAWIERRVLPLNADPARKAAALAALYSLARHLPTRRNPG